jgi:hypothetical protein
MKKNKKKYDSNSSLVFFEFPETKARNEKKN